MGKLNWLLFVLFRLSKGEIGKLLKFILLNFKFGYELGICWLWFIFVGICWFCLNVCLKLLYNESWLIGFFGVVLIVLGIFGGGVIGEMKLCCCFLNGGLLRELLCFLEEFKLGNLCVLGRVLCLVFVVFVMFFFECFFVEFEFLLFGVLLLFFLLGCFFLCGWYL